MEENNVEKKKRDVKGILFSFLVLALAIGAVVGVTVINTQNIEYYNDIWAKASNSIVYNQYGVTNADQAKNGSQYLENITNKLFIILGILGGIMIAILWVKVAINFFSDDPQRKALAKEDMIKALVGTIIIAMAVFGAVWAIAGWMIGATQIITLPQSILFWA